VVEVDGALDDNGATGLAQRVGHALGVTVVGATLFAALPVGSQFTPGGLVAARGDGLDPDRGFTG
jgi:hypothetical protein